jgi:hypothetical protein
MLTLNNFALCALAFLPIVLTAQTQVPSADQMKNANDHHAETAIEQVMKQYHAAILAHDGTALSGLFLPDANLWLNVLTDSAYARAQSKSATAQKIRVGRYRDFAKLVSTTSKNFDPEHSNVVIHRMVLSRLFISILFSTSTGRPTTAVARPGNWSKRPMAGELRPSSTPQSRLCSNRDWRQDPMPDVFQIDDRGAVKVAMLTYGRMVTF